MKIDFKNDAKWKFSLETEGKPVTPKVQERAERCFRVLCGATYLLQNYFDDDQQEAMLNVLFATMRALAETIHRAAVWNETDEDDTDAIIERLLEEVQRQQEDDDSDPEKE